MSAVQLIIAQRERKALLRRLEDADNVKQARKVLAAMKTKDWIPHEKVKARLGWKLASPGRCNTRLLPCASLSVCATPSFPAVCKRRSKPCNPIRIHTAASNSSGEDDLYRVRVGDYRILYAERASALLVLVTDIGNRRDIYR